MNGSVAHNISRLRDSINAAGGGNIQLVLVSKTVPAERVHEAYDTGVRDFGENRVQELLQKKDALPADARWHLIGHLQTNKVKQVLGKTVLIHSLDRPELAEEIERQARLKGIPQVDCLVQVNSSGEKTKYGLELENVADFVSFLVPSKVEGLKPGAIRLRGLMTIGPLTEDAGLVREAFRKTRKLQENLKQKFPSVDWSLLSMGMSGDYKIAIEEGSTLVRIGTAVFGERRSL